MRGIKLPGSDKWLVWISISIFVKTLFSILVIYGHKVKNFKYDTFGIDAGDSSSYIEPIENLIANGVYFDDYRMPGYGWLYYIFRLFASQPLSLNMIIILQMLFSAISVYILGLIAERIFKKSLYFYLTFFIYLISTFVSLYDITLLTESFCTSSMIFSIFYILKGTNKDNFFSGLFLTWAIFLRPVFAPLLFIYLMYILLDRYKKNELRLNQKLVYSLFCLLVPFILIDGAWIFRNYLKYQKVIALTKSVYYTNFEDSYFVPLFKFMNAFGGSIVWWEPSSEITFFKELPNVVKVKKSGQLPDYIYTSKFNLDSLILVRDDIRLIESPNTPVIEKKEIEKRVKGRLEIYTESIRVEKPFLYHFSSRVKVFKSFFLHSGTYNLFNKPSSQLNKFELALKIFYSALYLAIVIIGLFALFILLLKTFSGADYFLISSCGLYSSLVFPILLKMDEYRYFVPAYPIFLLATVFAVISIYQSLFRKKNTE